MILSAQEKAGVRQEDQQQQRAQVLAGSCPLCGHNKYGTVNCCSKGGTWEGKCTNDLRDGGEHTWIEGFNACKEPIPEDEEPPKQEQQQRQQPASPPNPTGAS